MYRLTVDIWHCDYCDEVFLSSVECENHEKTHNACNNCKNAYYVYGCEFACKFYDLPMSDPNKCGKNQNYKKWEPNEQ